MAFCGPPTHRSDFSHGLALQPTPQSGEKDRGDSEISFSLNCFPDLSGRRG